MMGINPIDYRCHFRFPLHDVPVRGVSGNNPVRLLDISFGGVALLSPVSLQVGELLTVELPGRPQVTLSARYCAPQEPPPNDPALGYRIGAEFSEGRAGDAFCQAVLHQYASDYGEGREEPATLLDKRRHVRIALDDGLIRAQVDGQSLSVADISDSGMSLLSPEALEPGAEITLHIDALPPVRLTVCHCEPIGGEPPGAATAAAGRHRIGAEFREDGELPWCSAVVMDHYIDQLIHNLDR